MLDPYKVTPATRQVMGRTLLNCLESEEAVAVLLSLDDLDLIIRAIRYAEDAPGIRCERLRNLLEGLETLQANIQPTEGDA